MKDTDSRKKVTGGWLLVLLSLAGPELPISGEKTNVSFKARAGVQQIRKTKRPHSIYWASPLLNALDAMQIRKSLLHV